MQTYLFIHMCPFMPVVPDHRQRHRRSRDLPLYRHHQPARDRQRVINYGSISPLATPLASKQPSLSAQAVVQDVSLIVAGVVPRSKAANESGGGKHGKGNSICVCLSSRLKWLPETYLSPCWMKNK